MGVRNIKKQLIGKEDLELGFGQIIQERNGKNLEISRINAGIIPYTEDKSVSDVLDSLANYSVNSTAELKTISNVESVAVLGYYEKGDGGGGTFYWDNTSTETDNGGTIIQATGVTTGRWKRVFSGAVNVKWFGAKGDGISDDTIAIQKAINSMTRGTILIPIGTFLLDTITYIDPTHIFATRGQSIFAFLFLKSNVSIIGESKESIIKVASGQLVKSFTYTADTNSGVYPNYNMPGTKGFQVFAQSPNDTIIENITIENITVDLNGYNNKMYPINAFGNQSLCQAMFIKKGNNINVVNNLFKDSPGHQVLCFDIECGSIRVHNNEFLDCGLLDGTNTNLTDHSTIYSMSSNSYIAGNRLIQTLVWDSLAGGCPIEVHNSAIVKDNYIYQYANCGVLSALIANGDFNCRDNIYENIAILGFDLYCRNSYTLNCNIENNKVSILKRNILDTHPAYSHRNFIVSTSIGYSPGDVSITLNNNNVTMTGELLWNESLVDKYNYIIHSNLIKKININNNIFTGFRGAIAQLDLQPASSSFSMQGNEFISCGVVDGYVSNNAVINYVNNNQGDYGIVLSTFKSGSNKFYSCLYSSYFNFNINIGGYALSPTNITINDDFTDEWFTTIYNNSGVDLPNYTSKMWSFNYSCTSAMTSNEILKVLPSSVNNINKTQYGNITINKSGYVYKYNSMWGVPSWKCEFISYGATVPTTGEASPFGSIEGDKKWIINPVAGGYIGYVCTSAGNPGTWKTFGAISA